MAVKKSNARTEVREAPKSVVIAAIVLVVIGLCAGGFYAYNGGWKTAAQQTEQYNHEFLPLMAAKHGDTAALEAENKLRQSRGQALLEPKRKKESVQAGDRMQQLAEMRKKLGVPPSGQ